MRETLQDDYDLACTGSGDQVLLDIMMARMNGHSVCRTIKSSSSSASIKVILISGKAMVEERLEGYSAGADDYMT